MGMSIFRGRRIPTYLNIPNDVQQSNNIRSSSKILQDFDFPLDLLLLHGLEDFDDTFLVGGDVDGLEYL